MGFCTPPSDINKVLLKHTIKHVYVSKKHDGLAKTSRISQKGVSVEAIVAGFILSKVMFVDKTFVMPIVNEEDSLAASVFKSSIEVFIKKKKKSSIEVASHLGSGLGHKVLHLGSSLRHDGSHDSSFCW